MSEPSRARVVVLPIPYEATTTFGAGTREGPRAIIAASQQVELYDEGLGRVVPRAPVATLSPLEPDARAPEFMQQRIYRAARSIVRQGKFLLALGGEHSITAGLVRAVRATHKKLSVLQIDAHADLRNSYQGSRYSHACVMRRVYELGVPIVAVGLRSYCAEEARFLRRSAVTVVSPRACRTTDAWVDRVVAGLGPDVYVTIDIDGFDPAMAPGTGTPEPGGLDWFQVTDLLAAVARARRIVAADVVEVRPLPPSNVTEFLAARLAHRLIGLTGG